MKKFSNNKFFKKITEKIFINFKIKFICFILAILMYLTVSLFIQRITKTYTAKFKIVNLKDYLIIANDLPETIKINATDKPEIFDKISEEDFNLRLDLSSVKGPGEANFKLKWDIPHIMHSFFSSIVIEPGEFPVKVDMLAEKNVKIIPNKIGDPAKGFIEKRLTIEPPFVRIQGPASIINKINFVKTETINIEGIQESFRRQVNLFSDYSVVKILGKAELFFEIIEATDFVSLKYNNVVFQKLKPQFKAVIKNEITVKITGSKNDIKNLNKNNIVLYVDCDNINFPGEYTCAVNVRKPAYYDVISIMPEDIKVTVEEK